jgi:hypothetical protein
MLLGGAPFSTGAAGGGGGSIDPYFSSVVLLLGFEGADGATSTVDESPSAKTVTFNGNAQLDTAQAKFGTSSLLLDGTGDFLSLADSADWDFGSGQFTVESFVRLSSVDNTYCIMAQWASGAPTNAAWALYCDTVGLTALRYRFVDNTGTTRDAISSAITNVANQWFHYAADRDGTGKVRVYIDGAMIGSATNSQTFRNSTNNLRIGSIEGFSFDFGGWLDELRITKGVARYASDSGFTVPTAAFPRR